MAVKLRLTRVGKTKQPQYRIVAADSRSPRDGRFIEIVGHYNPRTEPSTLKVDNVKAVKWLQQGAEPTDSDAPTAVAVLTHIVTSIVDDPDAVQVETSESRGRVRLDVRVGPG